MGRTKKESPRYVTTGFVAKQCGVTSVTVLRWIEKGHLPAFRLPEGHYRIRVEDVSKFMEKCSVNANNGQD